MEQGLCQGHTPIPLADDRDRFLRLVEDISHRKDEYAAQLSSLTIAEMSSPVSQKSGEQRYELISSLLSSDNSGEPDAARHNVELWQARLVLAIAEILDREEEDLQQHLQILDSQELEMLRKLQGETDGAEDPFAQLEEIQAHLLLARPGEMKKRFTAWLTLLRHQPLPPDTLWLASSRDSGDQVMIEFEKHHDAPAIPVLQLLIPSHIRISTSHLVDQISRFHNQSSDIHKALRSQLTDLARNDNYDPTDANTLIPDGTDWAEQWQASLENFFPESSHGRKKLTIYLLPNTTINKLFSLPEDEHQPTTFKNGLLGVLDS